MDIEHEPSTMWTFHGIFIQHHNYVIYWQVHFDGN